MVARGRMTICARILERFNLLRPLNNWAQSKTSLRGVSRVRSGHSLYRKRGFVWVSSPKQMSTNSERCDSCLYMEAGIILSASEIHVGDAINAIKGGKVIAVPTDTLYGFACDACSMEAVHRIYDIKGRKHTTPLAICVGDVPDIARFAIVDHLPHRLLNSLLPGPVTIVLNRGFNMEPKRKLCCYILCFCIWTKQVAYLGDSSILEKSLNPGLDSIGVRVPDSEFIQAIARGSRSALALTSANLSGQPSSVCITDFECLWQHCAYVYDGGVLPAGRAGSTVVDLTKPGTFKILRPGSAREETTSILKRFNLDEAP